MNILTIYENFISYYIIYHSIMCYFKEQLVEINCFHLNKLEAQQSNMHLVVMEAGDIFICIKYNIKHLQPTEEFTWLNKFVWDLKF